MMKKTIFLTAACLLALTALAKKKQKSSEFGIFIGCSYYIGDLNPTGHFSSLTKPAGGLMYRYNFNPRLSLRASGTFGTVQGNDAISPLASQQKRNLHFKSNVSELSVVGEFNFLEYTIGKGRTIITPFVFLGVGVFKFNPRAEIAGNWVALQPLGTEGQGTTFEPKRKQYSLVNFCAPFGVGVKASIAQRVGITVDWGMRFTPTDYLDDVSKDYVDPVKLAAEHGPVAAALSDRSLSQDPGGNVGRQRGNSATRDWYSFAGITLCFKLRGKEDKCPGIN